MSDSFHQARASIPEAAMDSVSTTGPLRPDVSTTAEDEETTAVPDDSPRPLIDEQPPVPEESQSPLAQESPQTSSSSIIGADHLELEVDPAVSHQGPKRAD
jgi:hypothetical protein